MTTQPNHSDDEIRSKIVEIFGLETSPDNEPNYLLIRDENGTIVEGVDYSEEVDQLQAYVQQEKVKAVKRYQELQHEELVNEIIATEREARLQERKEARDIMWLHWTEKPLQCALLSQMLDDRFKELENAALKAKGATHDY